MCLFYVILPVACLNKFIERYINKIDYITVDRGDGMSDDAEEDNPVLVTEAVEENDENTQVNNPASEFDSKVPSNTGQ